MLMLRNSWKQEIDGGQTHHRKFKWNRAKKRQSRMKGDRLREEVGQTPGPWLREMHTQKASEMLSDKQESKYFLQVTYESCITSKGCTSEYGRSVIPGTSSSDLACIAAAAHLELVQSALGSEGGVYRASACTNFICWVERPARKLTPSWRATVGPCILH